MLTPARRARMMSWYALAIAVVIGATNAQAVPSYARQTGQECTACHVSFPELTPYGRYFKLTGYTIGKPAFTSEGYDHLPLAVMAQASITNVRGNRTVDPDSGDTVEVNPRNNQGVFSGASLFLAGKVTDHVGGFVQWTYDNLAADSNTGKLKGHSSLDNTDLRVAGTYSAPGAAQPDLVFGATLHNNPTVQDVWNSTPAFGYPYTVSPFGPAPPVATMIDGTLGQQVAGLGGYVYWKSTVYAEISTYRTASHEFSFLRTGQDARSEGGVAALKGYNPYFRVALTHDWGANSIMVGAFGLQVDRYPSNLQPSTGTDRFRDVGLDAQYQYITDPHTLTIDATYIREKQSYDTSFQSVVDTGAGIGAGPAPANRTDTLRTMKLKASYYSQRKYGATLAYFSTTGSADAGLYGTNGDGNALTPDTRGYTAELDYLPIQNVRLMLQYTAFTKFAGASTNIDGNGRNARDNDTLFFNVWVAF